MHQQVKTVIYNFLIANTKLGGTIMYDAKSSDALPDNSYKDLRLGWESLKTGWVYVTVQSIIYFCIFCILYWSWMSPIVCWSLGNKKVRTPVDCSFIIVFR